jgi:hypothetical protein
LLPVLFTLTQVVLLLITSTFTRVQIQSNLGTTVYNMVFQVTRGIFVNFHLYFDFWRVYLTDLNSYHWGKMRQLSLNQIYILYIFVQCDAVHFTFYCVLLYCHLSIYDINTILDYYQYYLCYIEILNCWFNTTFSCLGKFKGFIFLIESICTFIL